MNRKYFVGGIVALVGVLLFSSVTFAQQGGESPLVGQTWVRLGGPLGGLGYDVRMRPDNPDVMYVTDAWAGVHISTDGGRTWVNANDGIDLRTGPSGDAIPVFCLTIDPNHYDTIWIGLQNLGGVYRSDNGGKTWERRTQGIVESDGLTIRGISVEPGNSNVVYIAGEISSWLWAGNGQQGREFDLTQGVVYKTVDGGQNWQEAWRGDDLARYIWIDPTNTNVIYVSTGIFDREAANSGGTITTPGGEGILKSTDGGQTWTQVNTGLQNLYVGSLYMHPENPDILLAGTGNNAFPAGGGIHLSADGGGSWQRVAGTHITSVEFATSNPEIAYGAGAGEFYRSEDGGHTWRDLARSGSWGPDGIRPGFPIDFQVDPRDPYRIFVNNYGGGIFLSEDGGATWVSSSTGYTGADLTDISIDPINPGVVYVNGRSGPFSSFDGGVTWQGINPLNVMEIAEGARISLDPASSNHILMSSAHWGWTYESVDGGQSWGLVTDYSLQLQNLPYDDTNQKFQGMQTLAFAPSNSQVVYGGFGVWRCATDGDPNMCETKTFMSILVSTDGGKTWAVRKGTALEGLTVTESVVHPQDANIAWVATAGGGVFKTTDQGSSWQVVSNGLSDHNVTGLSIDLGNPNILYAGTYSHGVFKSEDGGESWVNSSAGMDPNDSITALVVDPTHLNVVYAGSSRSGLYLSEDAGQSWRLLNDGLRSRAISALSISADGETLYAATRGEGVFRLSTHDQAQFDAMAPELPSVNAPSNAPSDEIQIDGSSQDWSAFDALETDPTGDGEDDFLDLAAGYAYRTADALYFMIETPDPTKPFVHFDIMFEVDEQMMQISWVPGRETGFMSEITRAGAVPLKDTTHSSFAFGSALEGRIDFRDLDMPEKVNFRTVNVMAGQCCSPPAWHAADEWYTDKETPGDTNTMEQPEPAEEKPPVEEREGPMSGLPCPSGFAPLALVFAAWVSRRRM